MVTKRKTSKKSKKKKISKNELTPEQKKQQKIKQEKEKYPTLKIRTERNIAMDFAVKVYKKFDKTIKSIILFGSVAKEEAVVGSDIDIIVIIDDIAIRWDQELIAWYREELEKLIRQNPYQKSLHINTIKLSTWWDDLLRGEPVLINILRNGEPLIDIAGFYTPLKYLLFQGKIKPSPEAIYTSLQRAPMHIAQSKAAELGAIEGLYWAMVDSAHAALIASGISPPSPEHIATELRASFVSNGILKEKYIAWYRDLLVLHKKISHREISDLKGTDIDMWQERTEEFLKTMAELVNRLVS